MAEKLLNRHHDATPPPMLPISATLLPAIYMAANTVSVDESTLTLHDTARDRKIPVAIYAPPQGNPAGIVLFSHGYDRNKGGSFRAYSYLTRTLARHGYYVISIQHELPGDALLPMSGNLYRERMPNWQRGAANILFTLQHFRHLRPDLPWQRTILIGHSNGGDMSMLLASQHPELIDTVISLDHLRHPIPRTAKPRMYTLRSSDCEADPGVLPSDREQQQHPIGIISMDNLRHGDMDDKGTDEQHQRICKEILNILGGEQGRNHPPVE